ncbi:MAG: type II toxin-antitoxin system RelE/ParE family toxin [Steroidobacter sp.]
MIRTFRCEDTRTLFETGRSRRFATIAHIAMRKLAQLDAAETLEFLRSPPGNRLEKLKGDRTGSYCIHINDQWRICFRWEKGAVEEVEIVDYH